MLEQHTIKTNGMLDNNISATRVKTMCMELSEKSHTDSKGKEKQWKKNRRI